MGEENRKHGRKSGGHKHGGRDMKRAGKGHKATKRGGLGKVGLTRLERERRALAEAAPLAQAPMPPPVALSPREIAPLPTSFAGLVAKDPAPLAMEPRQTEAPHPGARVGSPMKSARLAALAFVVAALCGVAVLRACERKPPPVQDDTADTGTCSGDAALCVAQA